MNALTDRRLITALLIGGVLALAGLVTLFPSERGAVIFASNRQAPAATEVTSEDSLPEPARLPIGHYTESLKSDLFTQATPPLRRQAPKPPPTVAPTPAPPPPPAAPANPFSGSVYSGMARIDGKLLALVEEPGSGRGRFLSVGDRFGGGRITSINADGLTVRIDGRVERLARNQNYSLVPLNRSPDFMTAKPSAPAATPAAKPASAQQPPQPAAPSPPTLTTGAVAAPGITVGAHGTASPANPSTGPPLTATP